MPSAELDCPVEICEKGGKGLILPLFRDSEQDWPNELRIVLYLVGLLWFFMGVAIVADVFMGAIERITSKRKRKRIEATGKYVQVNVWNDTVANLTLMALGSSAPEILLSLIELVGEDFYSGHLGPSTIVGSAAFNLLVITGVCIIAIPDDESRTIEDIGVFTVTASFSLFAYFWLLIIVNWHTKNVIDIEEGVLTFLFFPLLVFVAYLADVGVFSKSEPECEDGALCQPPISLTEITMDELAEMEMNVRKKNSMQLSDDQLMKLIEFEFRTPRSRAAYRVGATRHIVGGRRVSVSEKQMFRSSQVVPESLEEGDEYEGTASNIIKPKPLTFEFISQSYAVMENFGKLSIPVKLDGSGFHAPVSVDYRTRDGTAKENEDYLPLLGTLTFNPGETEKTLEISIVDDAAYEDDEMFYVDLFNPQCSDKGFKAEVGAISYCQIAIFDDDSPGVLSFEEETLTVLEGLEDKVIEIGVVRKGGCRGEISVRYKTEGDTAVPERDFVPLDACLHFLEGQAHAKIDLTIKPLGRYEATEQFTLVLLEPMGGSRFDKAKDGTEYGNVLTIVITPNDERKDRTDVLMNMLVGNYDKVQIGHANWKDQFRDALFVNGGDDEASVSALDYFMHGITVFWKVLFACIPPVDFCDGWLCFWCSLMAIGGVTAFIGDIANLLGCTMNIPTQITAITFVALGTSLPDTFASKTAAEQDPYADASIGNVTGSNSVNVFLGLGLPWMIGGIYWKARGLNPSWERKYRQVEGVLSEYPDGGKFVVVGGDLGFSVAVFTGCAVLCIVLLMFRRFRYQAELGGPRTLKYVSTAFCVFLWIIYISLSSWKALDTRSKDPCYA